MLVRYAGDCLSPFPLDRRFSFTSSPPSPSTFKEFGKHGGAIMSSQGNTFIKGGPSQYVKLNVGGSLFQTTIGTLTKADSMLRAMFSGRLGIHIDSEGELVYHFGESTESRDYVGEIPESSDNPTADSSFNEILSFSGWVLIDRSGKHFGTILNFLRDGSVSLPDNSRELQELLAEAKYYLIQELIDSCESMLARSKENNRTEPICRVPLITSSKEEAMLINSSTKPVVKLLINRHNNKYSYTTTSDDNFLKNLELFDKLCLRFSGRVLFIKDVIGTSEICCWSFYGHGKKVAEVCCHSILYAPDRKHTKVEFPEARIYEETLNVLMYENLSVPDMELMQATSSRGAVSMNYTSDDEDEVARKTSIPSQNQAKDHLNKLRNSKQ